MVSARIGLAALTLLAARAALGGWTAPASIAGSPVDVVAVSETRLVAITSDGAYEFLNGALARQLTGTGLVSGFVDSAGCFAVMSSSGYLGSVGGCGYGFQTPLDVDVQRLRVSPGGYAWACSGDVVTNRFAYSATGGRTQASWATTAAPGACAPALSVSSAGGSERALFALARAAEDLALFENGALVDTASTLETSIASPLSVQLVGGGAAPLRAFVVSGAGRLEVSQIAGGFGPFEVLPLPPGVAGFRAIALYQSEAERFGMALAEAVDGSAMVLSAVPAPDSTFGTEWRPSTAPPAGAIGRWMDLHCDGPRSCAAMTSGVGAGSVLLYRNGSGPGAPVVAPLNLAAGAVASVEVSDPDGDAVWLTWTQTAPASPLLGVERVAGANALRISAPTPTCREAPFTLAIVATDGRAGHESPPSILEVSVPTVELQVGAVAGGPMLASCDAETLRVTAAADVSHQRPESACAEQSIGWTQVSGPAALAGTARGEAVSLRAEGAGWDALVGREVGLELVATAEGRSSAPAQRAVPIAAAHPFVRLTLSSDAPVAEEGGAVGLEISLVNESACPVESAAVDVRLGDARLVPGSVRLDGARAEAAFDAAWGSARIEGIALPPGQRRSIHLSARPGLWGDVSPRAVAALGEAPISEEAALGARAEPAGCGCSSGKAAAAWALAALALLLVRTRR